jgi:hypothetical protein
LPSITNPLTITGTDDDTTIIERQDGPWGSSAPLLRLLHVATSGSLRLNGVTLQGGLAILPQVRGGGIYNHGTLILTHVTLTHNAGRGGGIYNDVNGVARLTHCSLTDNDGATESGGGILNPGTLTLIHSPLVDNRTTTSGGIENSFGGSATLTNSTLAHNHADGGPGGGTANVFGGAVTLTHVTLAYNTGSTVGGIFNGDDSSVTVHNTILVRNTASSSSSSSDDCAAVVTSLGTNLIGTTSGCTIMPPPDVSDLEAIDDPGLGNFTDKGRPGNGHVPLLPSSPTIDAGNDAACPTRDQLGQPRRNIPRVGTSRCDIGAIEFQRRDTQQRDEVFATAAPATP